MTHGFLRNADGVITVLDGPGALETYAVGINETGTITGGFQVSPDGSGHAFLRSPDGEYTLFDVPTEVGIETVPTGINDAGTVAGIFVDRNFNYGVFVRAADGTFSHFHAPNGGQIVGLSIDSRGDVTGWYWDRSGSHGFVRTAHGTLRALNSPPDIACIPTSINDAGDITGFCNVNQSYGAFWGAFVQERNGRFFRLDVPSTIQVVRPSGINSAREITGTYNPAGEYTTHAFLRTWKRSTYR
jgi:uncharacterized membrane protein